jgi:hypothetical protein
MFMEWYDYLIWTVCIIAIIAVALVILINFIVMPIVVDKAVFSKRQERNKLLKYFSANDFGLTVEKVPLNYNGHNLYGAVYSKGQLKECEKLIIFAHGIGPGHCAYMTEVAYYCNKGYAVLAYDSLGCDRSEGKNIHSFYTGAECVVAAYIGAKCHKHLKDLPVYLVGHSWGGYSVLCASQQINVKGVVAFSAFSSPAKTICSLACANSNKMMKPMFYLMTPSLNLIAACKNMRTGSKNAAKAIALSKTPALLVWGEKDAAVNAQCSAACVASGDNVQKLIIPDRAHNVYNTVAAEGKLAELSEALGKVSRGQLTGEQAITYFSGFDYVAATEEDLDIMQKTVDFMESL